MDEPVAFNEGAPEIARDEIDVKARLASASPLVADGSRCTFALAKFDNVASAALLLDGWTVVCCRRSLGRFFRLPLCVLAHGTLSRLWAAACICRALASVDAIGSLRGDCAFFCSPLTTPPRRQFDINDKKALLGEGSFGSVYKVCPHTAAPRTDS